MLSEESEILKRRDDGPMDSPLDSQVMLGAGLPFAAQVKRAEEPAGSSWSTGPSMMDSGSVGKSQEHHEVQLHTWKS